MGQFLAMLGLAPSLVSHTACPRPPALRRLLTLPWHAQAMHAVVQRGGCGSGLGLELRLGVVLGFGMAIATGIETGMSVYRRTEASCDNSAHVPTVHSACCVSHGAWCVVHDAWCMVHGAWCMVHGAWCVMCGVCCVVCGVWCVRHGVWSTARTQCNPHACRHGVAVGARSQGRW